MSLKDRVYGRSNLDKVDIRRRKKTKDIYHGFFEGYEEQIVTDDKGKNVLKRIYVGDYYQSSISGKNGIKVRFLYLTLILLCIAVFLLCGLWKISMNVSVWYTEIFQAVEIALTCWVIFTYVMYLLNRNVMTEKQYNESSVRLKTSALADGICFLCSFLAEIVFIALNSDVSVWNHIVISIGYFFCAAATLSVHYVEKHIRYEQIAGVRTLEKEAALQ